jgi:cytochrome c-type biogenesis protein CcsB
MGRLDVILFWVALGLYSCGWLLIVGGPTFRRAALSTLGWRVLVGGLAAHAASIASRWIATGHGPVMRDFENAMAGGWIIAAVSIFVAYRREAFRGVLFVAMPVTILLLGYGLTRPQDLEPLAPSLKTPWLYIHVTFAWIAFGMFTAAACAAVVFLAKERRSRTVKDDTLTRSLTLIDELQFRLILYGFVAAAVMIASGALWAKILWGSYWGWDPVETWSLAAFLIYGLYIHLRLIFGWRMVRAAWFAVFAVVPVFVSFWGVGLMMTSRHLFDIMDMLNR